MSDAFDRLKKKGIRPTVPTRDTSLVKKENTEMLNNQMTEFSHLKKTQKQDFTPSEVLQDNAAIAHKEQETDLPETVRRTIRLEEDIDTELNAFCTAKKITRDTFIEAAFMACSGNQALMQEIVEEAKKRYHQRKQAGEQRKFQTMAKKINS